MAGNTRPAYGWLDRLRLRHPYPLLLERLAEIDHQERAGTRILDVPAGNGVLSLPLRAAGFDVTPCDLFPETLQGTLERMSGRSIVEVFETCSHTFLLPALATRLFADPTMPLPQDLACVPADMEGRLPFDDSTFDVALCVEGIEHVKNRHALLEELRRVLRPGGTLILTTPNLLSVRARLAFCLSGQRAFRSYLDEYTDVWGRAPDGRVFHGHAFLINYFQARYSLHHSGFRIRRPLPSNVSPTSLLLWPLFYLPIAWFTRGSQRKARRQFRQLLHDGTVPPGTAPPFDEMRAHVLSPELLLNAILILEAEAVP